MNRNESGIERVHVVCITHFDMGFTDLAERVLERYRRVFIPQAIALAETLNGGGKRRFTWTVCAFLIEDFLAHGEPALVRRLEAVIQSGGIAWSGLAFTTHTELLNQTLLDFDLSCADRLDARFGMRTISAKMTDVPGHTRALVGAMNRHGKRYLHIGVNEASMLPEVPDTFLWRTGEGELLVQYSPSYGSLCHVPGMRDALAFLALGDNAGLPDAAQMEAFFDTLRTRYPDAHIEASTLDAYAAALLLEKDRLPVVEEEIGDTWIHGIASDPKKTADYRTLLELAERWIAEGRLQPGTPAYQAFMTALLCVPEHTWGLDVKRWLFDFENWEKRDFSAARARDSIKAESFTDRNAALRAFVERELDQAPLQASYRFFEKGREEQRAYVKQALAALPKALRAEAEAAFQLQRERSVPLIQDGNVTALCGQTHSTGSSGKDTASGLIEACVPVEINGWRAAFDADGALGFLEKDGFRFLDGGCFGRLGYETYSAADVMREYYEYNRSFASAMVWSEADFAKPGLECAEGISHAVYGFHAVSMKRAGNMVEIQLRGDARAAERYGCPRRALVRYTFGQTVVCELSWQEKDANRAPEALWFDVCPDVENPARWKMEILGQELSPLDVVRGGNRRMHCVSALTYHGADGSARICTKHAPLASFGGRRLYGGCRQLPDLNKGMSFCLYNNKWGTNFPLWCEDDAYFRFEIALYK